MLNFKELIIDYLSSENIITAVINDPSSLSVDSTMLNNTGFLVPYSLDITNEYQPKIKYDISGLCLLKDSYYFKDTLNSSQYVSLWKNVLDPLIQAKDYSLNVCNFVFDIDYVYYDKEHDVIRYIYVPIDDPVSGHDLFTDYSSYISVNTKVSDPVIENRVFRALVQDFNPYEFMDMLLDYIKPVSVYEKLYKRFDINDVANHIYSRTVENTGFNCSACDAYNYCINSISHLSSGCELSCLDIIMEYLKSDAGDNNTQVNNFTSGFRYIGTGSKGYTVNIDFDISDGDIFTIGRHDPEIGKKRSCFEFPFRSKGISRRHAAVERNGNMYNIVDLSSSAGTYVNNKKIPPSMPVVLVPGCRVSFGNMGADYLWYQNNENEVINYE